mmetsp:Transcript_64457/g.168741  ORF Transcript_64457/g.168741 Transcript_64457/m.168741 type:complete len:126 (+) Transcript_64457:3-380(+)
MGGPSPTGACGGHMPMWQVVAPQMAAPAAGVTGHFMPPPPPLAPAEAFQQTMQWHPWSGGPTVIAAPPAGVAGAKAVVNGCMAPAGCGQLRPAASGGGCAVYPAGSPTMAGCGTGFMAFGLMPQQ